MSISKKSIAKEEIQKYIAELRSLLAEKKELDDFRNDDCYLQRFLYSAYFDVTMAFEWMEKYYNLFKEYPTWFITSSPLKFRDQLEISGTILLPDRDRYNRRIMIVKIEKLVVSKTTPEQQSQIFDMWLESFIDEPLTLKNGLSVIVDTKQYSWRLFRWLTPINLRVCTLRMDLYPIRDIVFHIVNTSFLVNASIKVVWPFLSERIKKHVKFHFEDLSSLHQYIDPKVLPPEYRGSGPAIDNSKIYDFLYDKDLQIETSLNCYKVAKEVYSTN